MFLLTAQTVERFAGLPHCVGSFPNTCFHVIAIKTEEKSLGCFLLDYCVIFTHLFLLLSFCLLS